MDSLYWMKGEHKRRSIFVENRVKRIRELVPPFRWMHCPGELNPADLPSRGCENCTNDVINGKLRKWLKGPEFMYKNRDFLPEDVSKIDSGVQSSGIFHDDSGKSCIKHGGIGKSNDVVIKSKAKNENTIVKNNVDVHCCLNLVDLVTKKVEEEESISKMKKKMFSRH